MKVCPFPNRILTWDNVPGKLKSEASVFSVSEALQDLCSPLNVLPRGSIRDAFLNEDLLGAQRQQPNVDGGVPVTICVYGAARLRLARRSALLIEKVEVLLRHPS